MFEVLDQMNLLDAENGTQNVGVYNEVIAVDKYTSHGKVTIGVSAETAQELALNQNNKRAILLIVDMNVYNKLTAGS